MLDKAVSWDQAGQVPFGRADRTILLAAYQLLIKPLDHRYDLELQACSCVAHVDDVLRLHDSALLGSFLSVVSGLGSNAFSSRVFRARLAIFLRCILRLDRAMEDWQPPGAWCCLDCGSSNYTAAWFTSDGISRCNICNGATIDWKEAGLPLWCSAPPSKWNR